MSPAQSDAVAEARSNPGETLCKAREDRGLSLSDAATRLNLSISALSCLEAGAFDRLPGHTFARGYIRAYAKLLELDQNRLVLEFDQFTGTDATGSAVHGIGRVEEVAKLGNGFLRLLSFVVLALIFVAGIFWWQEQAELRELPSGALDLEHVEVEGADGTTQIHPLDEPEDQAVEVAADSLLLPLTSVAETESTPVTEIAGLELVTEPSVATVVTEPVAVTSNQEPVAVETAQVEQSAVAAGEGLVVIKFTATCWMQLTDANGKVLLSTLKRAGETVELAAKIPAELRLGFAPGAQVSFNGQPIDLAPFTSGETARLKLGQ